MQALGGPHLGLYAVLCAQGYEEVLQAFYEAASAIAQPVQLQQGVQHQLPRRVQGGFPSPGNGHHSQALGLQVCSGRAQVLCSTPLAKRYHWRVLQQAFLLSQCSA